MKITRLQPVSKPALKEEEKIGPGKNSHAANYTIDDIPGIFGIAQEDITPQVKEAFIKFARELDRLKARLHELEIIADEDPLVPVMNRRAFERELARTIAYGARYRSKACLVFFDIDNFKSVNDSLGHVAGDLVLRHLGHMLVENTRKSDIVGRIGGDEFAVVLMQNDIASATAKTRQLVRLLGETPVPGIKNSFRLHVSAGIAAIEGGDNVQDVLARADRDMYANKDSPASA